MYIYISIKALNENRLDLKSASYCYLAEQLWRKTVVEIIERTIELEVLAIRLKVGLEDIIIVIIVKIVIYLFNIVTFHILS